MMTTATASHAVTGRYAMAQLSESLVRDTIRIIDEQRRLQLTINEVRQLCYAWLQLHGYWSPSQEQRSGDGT